jgi:hypothetical protein
MRLGHRSCGVTVTGKTIRILVVDGEPTGLLVAEIRTEVARLEGWASWMMWSVAEQNASGRAIWTCAAQAARVSPAQ